MLARLHSHIQLMLESVLSLYFPAVMMLEVMYHVEAILVRISLTSVKTVLRCNNFLLWSVILQEGLLESLLELGWYIVKVGVLRT